MLERGLIITEDSIMKLWIWSLLGLNKINQPGYKIYKHLQELLFKAATTSFEHYKEDSLSVFMAQILRLHC